MKTRSSLLLSLALLAACSSIPEAEQFRNQPARTAPADKALVYFYRQAIFLNCAIELTVQDGTQDLGRLENGTYFAVLLDPGPHRFATLAQHLESDVTEADLKSGQTYYFRNDFYNRAAFPASDIASMLTAVDERAAPGEMATLGSGGRVSTFTGDCGRS